MRIQGLLLGCFAIPRGSNARPTENLQAFSDAFVGAGLVSMRELLVVDDNRPPCARRATKESIISMANKQTGRSRVDPGYLYEMPSARGPLSSRAQVGGVDYDSFFVNPIAEGSHDDGLPIAFTGASLGAAGTSFVGMGHNNPLAAEYSDFSSSSAPDSPVQSQLRTMGCTMAPWSNGDGVGYGYSLDGDGDFYGDWPSSPGIATPWVKAQLVGADNGRAYSDHSVRLLLPANTVPCVPEPREHTRERHPSGGSGPGYTASLDGAQAGRAGPGGYQRVQGRPAKIRQQRRPADACILTSRMDSSRSLPEAQSPTSRGIGKGSRSGDRSIWRGIDDVCATEVPALCTNTEEELYPGAIGGGDGSGAVSASVPLPSSLCPSPPQPPRTPVDGGAVPSWRCTSACTSDALPEKHTSDIDGAGSSDGSNGGASDAECPAAKQQAFAPCTPPLGVRDVGGGSAASAVILSSGGRDPRSQNQLGDRQISSDGGKAGPRLPGMPKLWSAASEPARPLPPPQGILEEDGAQGGSALPSVPRVQIVSEVEDDLEMSPAVLQDAAEVKVLAGHLANTSLQQGALQVLAMQPPGETLLEAQPLPEEETEQQQQQQLSLSEVQLLAEAEVPPPQAADEVQQPPASEAEAVQQPPLDGEATQPPPEAMTSKQVERPSLADKRPASSDAHPTVETAQKDAQRPAHQEVAPPAPQDAAALEAHQSGTGKQRGLFRMLRSLPVCLTSYDNAQLLPPPPALSPPATVTVTVEGVLASGPGQAVQTEPATGTMAPSQDSIAGFVQGASGTPLSVGTSIGSSAATSSSFSSLPSVLLPPAPTALACSAPAPTPAKAECNGWSDNGSGSHGGLTAASPLAPIVPESAQPSQRPAFCDPGCSISGLAMTRQLIRQLGLLPAELITLEVCLSPLSSPRDCIKPRPAAPDLLSAAATSPFATAVSAAEAALRCCTLHCAPPPVGGSATAMPKVAQGQLAPETQVDHLDREALSGTCILALQHGGCADAATAVGANKPFLHNGATEGFLEPWDLTTATCGNGGGSDGFADDTSSLTSTRESSVVLGERDLCGLHGALSACSMQGSLGPQSWRPLRERYCGVQPRPQPAMG